MTSIKRLNSEIKNIKHKYEINLYDDKSSITFYSNYGPINFYINKNYPFNAPYVKINAMLYDYDKKLYNEISNLLINKLNYDLSELIIEYLSKEIYLKELCYLNSLDFSFDKLIQEWSPKTKILDVITNISKNNNIIIYD